MGLASVEDRDFFKLDVALHRTIRDARRGGANRENIRQIVNRYVEDNRGIHYERLKKVARCYLAIDFAQQEAGIYN